MDCALLFRIYVRFPLQQVLLLCADPRGIAQYVLSALLVDMKISVDLTTYWIRDLRLFLKVLSIIEIGLRPSCAHELLLFWCCTLIIDAINECRFSFAQGQR